MYVCNVCKMHMESKYEYILEFDLTYLRNSTNWVITIYVHCGS